MPNTREGLAQLKQLGSQNTKYTYDYDPSLLERIPNKHADRDYFIKFNCPEFTAGIATQVTARAAPAASMVPKPSAIPPLTASRRWSLTSSQSSLIAIPSQSSSRPATAISAPPTAIS